MKTDFQLPLPNRGFAAVWKTRASPRQNESCRIFVDPVESDGPDPHSMAEGGGSTSRQVSIGLRWISQAGIWVLPGVPNRGGGFKFTLCILDGEALRRALRPGVTGKEHRRKYCLWGSLLLLLFFFFLFKERSILSVAKQQAPLDKTKLVCVCIVSHLNMIFFFTKT